MAFIIVAGDRVHVVGDSITQFGWQSAPNGFFDQINATWPIPAMAKNPGTASGSAGVLVSGSVGAVVTTQPTRKQTADTASGVVGNTAADIAAAVVARITSFNPTKVVLEVGVNDAIMATDPTAFGVSYLSIITQSRAIIPGLPFLCIGILCYGEQWSAGPAWGANSSDASILALDGQIQTICANTGSTYVDLRTPLLAYEVANNPGPPGAVSGVVTSDATHPIVTSGQVLMGTWVFQNVTVTP